MPGFTEGFAASALGASWLDASAKGVLILAAAALLASRARRPASRHLIWTLALAGTLAVPGLTATLPSRSIRIAPEAHTPGEDAFVSEADQTHSKPRPTTDTILAPTSKPPFRPSPALVPGVPPAPRRDLAGWMLGVWVLIAAALLGPWFASLARVHGLSRRSRPVEDEAWVALADRLGRSLGLRKAVRLRRSVDAVLPMTWGWLRPVILLPADADAWDPARRSAALLHELEHVRRGDCLTQQVAHLACALQWHNPLAWLAARRMRVERERACDDRVLLAGILPSDYAGLLLGLARGRIAARGVGVAAVAMGPTRPSLLESRVREILDPSRDRRGPSRRAVGMILAATCGIVVGLSSVRLSAQAQPQAQPDAAGTLAGAVISGRVLDPGGTPVAGARLVVTARPRAVARGGDLSSGGHRVVASATADGAGAFRIGPVPPISSALYRDVKLMATAPGFGPGGREIQPDAESVAADVRLHPARRAEGRLVDREGKPAAGVEVRVWLMKIPGNDMLAGLILARPEAPPREWPGPATTDADGRFALDGLPADLEVGLNIDDDRFARQGVGTIPADAPADARVDATLDPAQWVEGTVIDASGGAPLPGARITVFSSTTFDGSYGGLDGVADAQGRFRVHALRGKVVLVTAYPPEGSPGLIVEKRFDWPEGATTHRVDFALPRGVLLRGTVVTAGTGRPVAGASVQYYPSRDARRKADEKVITGWSASVVSGPDGAFQIAVVPGQGHLLVHGPDRDYVLREIGEETLRTGKPGGQRYYAHGIVPYDARPGAEPPAIAVALKPGVTVTGQLVGPGGEAVDEALMASRLDIYPLVPYYRGFPEMIRGGRFALHGCDPGQSVPVHFLDPKDRWGATVAISGRDAAAPMTITLAPCGSATVRLVDPEGKPRVNLFPSLYLAVTPGPTVDAGRIPGPGVLAADEGYIMIIDRRNYVNNKATFSDANGRSTLPALIPGAQYRIHGMPDGTEISQAEFTVRPGENVVLPDIVGPDPKEKERPVENTKLRPSR